MTPRVREILDWYSSENPGLLTNLSRLFNSGQLAGTGRLSIIAVTEDLLAKPAQKFAANPNSYEPNYHIELALDSGISAYMGSLGAIEVCARSFAGELPMILNLNTYEGEKSVLLATTADALRLGCTAVGFTINYKGSISSENLSQLQRTLSNAKQVGLPFIVNIYCDESIDEVAGAVQASVQMGAHIVIVKTPGGSFSSKESEQTYSEARIRVNKLYDRVKHTLDCAFNGKRLVLFASNKDLNTEELNNEVKEIARGGGFGSMVGLAALRVPKPEAVSLVNKLVNNFKV